MSAENIIDLIAGVLLGTGLVAGAIAIVLGFKAWRRSRREKPIVRVGSAFNVNSIAPGVERVRADYLLALHSRPHPRFHPATLLAAARASLHRFAYFKEHEEHPESAAEETTASVQ